VEGVDAVAREHGDGALVGGDAPAGVVGAGAEARRGDLPGDLAERVEVDEAVRSDEREVVADRGDVVDVGGDASVGGLAGGGPQLGAGADDGEAVRGGGEGERDVDQLVAEAAGDEEVDVGAGEVGGEAREDGQRDAGEAAHGAVPSRWI
jgi:hypothetical protein